MHELPRRVLLRVELFGIDALKPALPGFVLDRPQTRLPGQGQQLRLVFGYRGDLGGLCQGHFSRGDRFIGGRTRFELLDRLESRARRTGRRTVYPRQPLLSSRARAVTMRATLDGACGRTNARRLTD